MAVTIDELKRMVWNARWIWGPGPGEATIGAPPNPDAFSTRYFRRTFDLASPAGAQLVVHVSADSRYRFYVNGQPVGRGPARSDLDHYTFETYDVSSLLRAGRNVLAAQVFHFGLNGPVAEMHDPHGGFVLQGTLDAPGAATLSLDTDAQWRVLTDRAYAPRMCFPKDAYIVINPFDEFRGAEYPWGWQSVDYDDAAWAAALLLPRAVGRNQLGHPRHRWRLTPREIAPMTETPTVPEAVLPGPRSEELLALLRNRPDAGVRPYDGNGRAATGPALAAGAMPTLAWACLAPGQHAHASVGMAPRSGAPALEIPARSEADWTIYMGRLFTGYPRLTTSGGAGAEVELRYAEALSKDGGLKSRRDDFTFGEVEADMPSDVIRPGGGDGEAWEPLWYRCGRYLRLRVRTGDAPLRIDALTFAFASYPFRQQATFESNDPQLRAIWDIAWHTALCCAHEHYEDCPFYEQLQYVSDTRLQMLISYYVAGDDTLARQAIQAFDRSLLPEGLIQSRYPSNLEQIIPTFCLYYVLAVEDHWQHRGDRAFVKSVARSIGPVMHWFERHLGDDGLVGFIPWWVFVDWRWQRFRDGVMPESRTGVATFVNLLYILALDSAARVYRVAGDHHHADIWEKRAQGMREAVRRAAWSESEGLFLDGPGSPNLSQHTNVMAILSDTATPDQTARIMKRLMTDPTLVQATYIFDYYVFQALLKVGAYDQLDVILNRWRAMVDYGFSTFPETPEPARSDCHAWSAWPMFELLRTVLGVRPASPGYAAVTIAPHPLAGMTEASGSVPTPRGAIRVSWRAEGGRMALRAVVPEWLPTEIVLPDGTRRTLPEGGEATVGDPALATLLTRK
jgi:hypothetical protein